MTDNNINQIEHTAFNSLDVLDTLIVKSNFIETFYNFNGIGDTLSTLVLDNNDIASITKEDLSCFENLEKNSSTQNPIGEIPDFSLMPARGVLETLILNDNSIMEFNSTRLTYLTNLRDLYLAANSMTDIPALGNLPFANTLEKVSIGANLITSVKNDTFVGCTKLSYLSWYSSGLMVFPADVLLQVAPTLTALQLTGNLLNLKGATWFPEWLGKISSLDKLILIHNLIETAPDFHHEMAASSLADLYLNGNPLICDCRLAWLRDVDSFQIHVDEEPCFSPSPLVAKSWRSIFKMDIC